MENVACTCRVFYIHFEAGLMMQAVSLKPIAAFGANGDIDLSICFRLGNAQTFNRVI